MDVHSFLPDSLPMAKKRIPSKSTGHAARKFGRLYVLEWLEMLDLTQASVADRTGLTEGFISLLANGKKQFTQETLEKVARAMGVEPAGLLYFPPMERPVWDKWHRLDPTERRRFMR